RLDSYRGVHTAAIAVNDKTRPVPHQFLLPPLLKQLENIGIAPQDIHLVIATGTHLPIPPEEFSCSLPKEIISRYPVSSHDCDAVDGLIELGTTTMGTPVKINRVFMEADLRIVVGNLEPHHFMGFSGGAKSAAIGLAGRNTINTNHAMLLHENAKTGHYEDNPMRQDVEEIGRMIGLQFAVNAILNQEKEIVRVIAGDPSAVMQTGIPYARGICQAAVLGLYDLVIASAGGHPKDINFYQSQKALTHSSLIVRDQGKVILAAACPEGSGSASYERFMDGLGDWRAVLERFRLMGFQVGPHKALQVARIISRIEAILVSKLPPEQVKHWLLRPALDLNSAIAYALSSLPRDSRIAVMPYAVTTVPILFDAGKETGL
ncbi:MAG: nickel-dependent lactate racemase, partial [Anaerolineaceae bacterium]|nr:nickel-dependent lactate racemase [Anaerolineaceae bacterium]